MANLDATWTLPVSRSPARGRSAGGSSARGQPSNLSPSKVDDFTGTSASAAAPSSAAPKSAAAPLVTPTAVRTMAQRVARVKEELSLDPSLPVAKAVAEANSAMGIEGQGTLAQQVDVGHIL